MKKTKRILAGIMTVCLMGGVTVIPESIVPAVSMAVLADDSGQSESEKRSGICGENLTWEIENRVLTISGTGDMYDNGGLDPWWWGWYANINEVVFKEGVTSIGELAFRDCYIEKVTLPDSIVSIGEGAFSNCRYLEEINIPDSVKNIGDGAFYATAWLGKKITENPLFIVNNILIDGTTCTGDVVIPNGVTSILASAFYGSTLTSIEIPDSVTYIGSSAFYGTPWLEEKQKENPLVIVNNILIDGTTCEGDVVIPNSVTDIAGLAFYNCNGLTSMTIPDSVTNIGSYAFGYCTNLTEVTILNPECEIDDTINDYGIIRGYENSTAQAYAEKYGYNFESIGQAPEKETALGDVNNDGLIDANDATTVLIEYSKLSTGGDSTFTEQQKKSADVNGDSLIDAVDATFILSYYAHVSTGGTMKLPEFIGTTGSEN